MGKKNRKTSKAPLQESTGLVNNPFDMLTSDGLEPGPEKKKVPEEPVTKGVKLVVRLERKGRAGKTVTVIEGFPPDASATDALVRDLRRELGTGGTVYDDSAELQGDQRSKAAGWLRAKGYTVKGA